MHNSLVDGDDQGSCQKTFSEKKTVVDFLEDKQLVSTQLQWTYFISLYPLHLEKDWDCGVQKLSLLWKVKLTKSIFKKKLQKSKDALYNSLILFFFIIILFLDKNI